jgi:pimeloyl-ACP methyl ester carboxylesterase
VTARAVLLVVLLAFLTSGANYAREKKWADEIIPGIVVGDPVFLEVPGHKFLAIYTEAGGAKAGLVIVHGIGVHPDWGLIGGLRGALADHGYTTLSVQMPVLAQEAKPEEYRQTFGEAAARLKVAVDFLRGKGYQQVVLVSHSMGSRMTRHFLTGDPGAPVAAWVCIGWSSDGDDFGAIRVPVLDLYGENDLPAVLQGAARRAGSIKDSKRSRQIMAPGADHFFNGRGAELVRYVREFLAQAL